MLLKKVENFLYLSFYYDYTVNMKPNNKLIGGLQDDKNTGLQED